MLPEVAFHFIPLYSSIREIPPNLIGVGFVETDLDGTPSPLYIYPKASLAVRQGEFVTSYEPAVSGPIAWAQSCCCRD